jgi:hypothetical protein
MTEPSVIQVALQCAEAFEQVRAGYFLGGSLASSLQGEPRATNDIDFVVDLHPSQVEPLAQVLGSDFEVDVEALREAVTRRGSWNIFHQPTVTKVDLFLLRAGAFDRSEFSRRRRVVLTAEGRGLFLKSPEDSVLRKLLWFREGGEVSSTQWRDVVQILRLAVGTLDAAHLREWASQLGVRGAGARPSTGGSGESAPRPSRAPGTAPSGGGGMHPAGAPGGPRAANDIALVVDLHPSYVPPRRGLPSREGVHTPAWAGVPGH